MSSPSPKLFLCLAVLGALLAGVHAFPPKALRSGKAPPKLMVQALRMAQDLLERTSGVVKVAHNVAPSGQVEPVAESKAVSPQMTPNIDTSGVCAFVLASFASLEQEPSCQVLGNSFSQTGLNNNVGSLSAVCTSTCYARMLAALKAAIANQCTSISATDDMTIVTAVLELMCKQNANGAYCIDLFNSFSNVQVTGNNIAPVCNLFLALGCCLTELFNLIAVVSTTTTIDLSTFEQACQQAIPGFSLVTTTCTAVPVTFTVQISVVVDGIAESAWTTAVRNAFLEDLRTTLGLDSTSYFTLTVTSLGSNRVRLTITASGNNEAETAAIEQVAEQQITSSNTLTLTNTQAAAGATVTNDASQNSAAAAATTPQTGSSAGLCSAPSMLTAFAGMAALAALL